MLNWSSTGNQNAADYPNLNANFNASAEPVRPRSSASARSSKIGSCLAYTAGAAHVRSILDPSYVGR